MTTANKTRISIAVDGIWAGSGNLVEGRIQDCAAQLGNDQDQTEAIYELIEEAIEEGRDEITIDQNGTDARVSWSIE